MVSVAVLVDGDNFSGKHAALILKVAKDMGDPTVARVYADAQRQSEWHKAVGFRLIHAGTGKNASDLLLVIDAMELALGKGIGCFVIVSSDGDFTHLAQRLREHGAQVTGVGEAKAPLAFRAACNSFVEIGAERSVALISKSPSGASDLDRKIRALIAEHSREGAGMAIMVLGQMMHARHGTRITSHGVQTWRAYLTARPDLYDLDPRGPEAKVRFRPAGFASAARMLPVLSQRNAGGFTWGSGEANAAT
jgi:hypothetical protein